MNDRNLGRYKEPARPDTLILPDLPEGWVWARVGDICDPVNGRAFKPSEWMECGVPIIRIQNLRDSEARFNYCQGEIQTRFRVEPGDLLFAWSGTPGTSFGAHVWTGPGAVLNQHIFNVRFDRDLICPPYFRDVLNQNISEYVRQAQGGVGLAHITKSKFTNSLVPLAPLPEQHRIVAAIEQHLTRLDAAVTALQRVQANLQRYRASVLKTACEGKLVPTEGALARAEGRDYEPADRLVARILAERRARWAAQPKRRGRYKEPAAPDTSALPELPEGWVWSSIGESFEVYVGATPRRSRPDYWDGDISWVSSGEVAFNRIKTTRERITKDGLENSSVDIHPQGTVLLGMIGEGKTRGQVSILDIPACNNQNSAAIRVSQARLSPEHVFYFLWGQYDATRRIGSGNNQPALNKSRVQEIPFPLPPLAEQHRIVAEVERRLSVVQQAEATVEMGLKRAERLRQSILKQAFSGQLVPQDPNDEPAAALLARIQAERAATETAAKARRKPRRRRPRPAAAKQLHLAEGTP